MNQPRRGMPLWETAVMIVSFIVLWGWYLSRQNAFKSPGTSEWPGWKPLMIAAVVALVVVMVRRMRRVRDALREGSAGKPPAAVPPSKNGRNGHGRA